MLNAHLRHHSMNNNTYKPTTPTTATTLGSLTDFPCTIHLDHGNLCDIFESESYRVIFVSVASVYMLLS